MTNTQHFDHSGNPCTPNWATFTVDTFAEGVVVTQDHGNSVSCDWDDFVADTVVFFTDRQAVFDWVKNPD